MKSRTNLVLFSLIAFFAIASLADTRTSTSSKPTTSTVPSTTRSRTTRCKHSAKCDHATTPCHTGGTGSAGCAEGVRPDIHGSIINSFNHICPCSGFGGCPCGPRQGDSVDFESNAALLLPSLPTCGSLNISCKDKKTECKPVCSTTNTSERPSCHRVCTTVTPKSTPCICACEQPGCTPSLPVPSLPVPSLPVPVTSDPFPRPTPLALPCHRNEESSGCSGAVPTRAPAARCPPCCFQQAAPKCSQSSLCLICYLQAQSATRSPVTPVPSGDSYALPSVPSGYVLSPSPSGYVRAPEPRKDDAYRTAPSTDFYRTAVVYPTGDGYVVPQYPTYTTASGNFYGIAGGNQPIGQIASEYYSGPINGNGNGVYRVGQVAYGPQQGYGQQANVGYAPGASGQQNYASATNGQQTYGQQQGSTSSAVGQQSGQQVNRGYVSTSNGPQIYGQQTGYVPATTGQQNGQQVNPTYASAAAGQQNYGQSLGSASSASGQPIYGQQFNQGYASNAQQPGYSSAATGQQNYAPATNGQQNVQQVNPGYASTSNGPQIYGQRPGYAAAANGQQIGQLNGQQVNPGYVSASNGPQTYGQQAGYVPGANVQQNGQQVNPGYVSTSNGQTGPAQTQPQPIVPQPSHSAYGTPTVVPGSDNTGVNGVPGNSYGTQQNGQEKPTGGQSQNGYAAPTNGNVYSNANNGQSSVSGPSATVSGTSTSEEKKSAYSTPTDGQSPNPSNGESNGNSNEQPSNTYNSGNGQVASYNTGAQGDADVSRNDQSGNYAQGPLAKDSGVVFNPSASGQQNGGQPDSYTRDSYATAQNGIYATAPKDIYATQGAYAQQPSVNGGYAVDRQYVVDPYARQQIDTNMNTVNDEDRQPATEWNTKSSSAAMLLTPLLAALIKLLL